MEMNIIKVPLSQLRPNPYQPPGRLAVGEEKNRKGGESVLRSGLIQIPVGRGQDGVYEIGDGWQRKCWYEWLFKNGHPEYESLPIDLRELTDEQMADLIEETDENKANLNVIDRAWLWKKRLADFPKTTQAEFARRRGLSQGEIANTMRLLDLPGRVQEMIISQDITESHGRVLLQLKEPALMLEYAKEAIENEWPVATLDAVLKTYLNNQKPRLDEPPHATNESETITEAESEAESEMQSETETEAPSETGTGEEPEEDEKTTITEKKLQECDSCLHCPMNGGSCQETSNSNRKYPCAKYALKLVGQPNEKPVAKPDPKKPEPVKTPPSAPEPTALKPNWGRKLVIEEKKDHVLVSIMKAGGLPVFKKFATAHETLSQTLFWVQEWVVELEEQWSKEGK